MLKFATDTDVTDEDEGKIESLVNQLNEKGLGYS